jgi:hypothetical protein
MYFVVNKLIKNPLHMSKVIPSSNSGKNSVLKACFKRETAC